MPAANSGGAGMSAEYAEVSGRTGVPAANLGGAGVSAKYAEVSGRGASSEFRGC